MSQLRTSRSWPGGEVERKRRRAQPHQRMSVEVGKRCRGHSRALTVWWCTPRGTRLGAVQLHGGLPHFLIWTPAGVPVPFPRGSLVTLAAVQGETRELGPAFPAGATVNMYVG